MNKENTEKKAFSGLAIIIGVLLIILVILFTVNVTRMFRNDKVTVSNDEVKVTSVFSKEVWLDYSSDQIINKILERKKEPTMLVALKPGNLKKSCRLGNLTVELISVLNSKIPFDNKMRIVSRSEEIDAIIDREVGGMLENQGDFHPDFWASLGENVGADVVLVGTVNYYENYFTVAFDMVDIAEKTFIPGVSLRTKVRGLNLNCN